VTIKNKSILIDTSTDLRQQALKYKIKKVDAVLYTHPHADHIHGIDELRSYNFTQKASIPVYGNEWTCRELLAKFNYIFRPKPVEGGGIPLLDLIKIDPAKDEIRVQGVPIVPIPICHGSKEALGYRFNRVAYVTDCSYIPPSSIDRLKGLSVLILDCLRETKHRTHFNLDQALAVVDQLRPKKTFFTHLAHSVEYREWTRKLPSGVSLAYDGLKIRA